MDDTTWIRALRRGDANAFEALYGAYRQQVYRYACSVSGSAASADDLLQEAFLGLLRNIDRIDETRPLLPYLLQSVKHRHVDRLRSFEERRRPLPATDRTTDPEEVTSQMERDESRVIVSDAIAALAEPQGEVVRLKVYGGLTYDAIAAQLAVPAATIRNRYRAALNHLRQLLGRSV
ncbi:MAG: RNA polymerase sigma factor [Planctomycetota bacterium]